MMEEKKEKATLAAISKNYKEPTSASDEAEPAE